MADSSHPNELAASPNLFAKAVCRTQRDLGRLPCSRSSASHRFIPLDITGNFAWSGLHKRALALRSPGWALSAG